MIWFAVALVAAGAAYILFTRQLRAGRKHQARITLACITLVAIGSLLLMRAPWWMVVLDAVAAAGVWIGTYDEDTTP